MKDLDRRTCGLLKAATIEADQHKRPTFIGGFVPHDRREYMLSSSITLPFSTQIIDQIKIANRVSLRFQTVGGYTPDRCCDISQTDTQEKFLSLSPPYSF